MYSYHRIRTIFVLSLGLFFSYSGFASNSQESTKPRTPLKAALEKAQTLRLSRHQEWLDLLEFKPVISLSTLSPSKLVSEADDPKFFYDQNGKTDPNAELQATLKALFSTKEISDQHAQCRFPARYLWLTEKLGLDSDIFPRPHCALYQQWRAKLDIVSATLVFPASHLNSPSSMFGHTLLRLDSAPSGTDSKLLSYALNYAANINPEDGDLAYAYKGLFGGYPGFLSIPLYHKKVKEYNRIENRDIWEYKLNLNAAEIDRLMRHTWELKETNFDYLFFSENCSYRLLTLLDVARPGSDMSVNFRWRAIPIDTVKAIMEAGFIENIEYRPSAATQLTHNLAQLSEEQKNTVKLLIAQPESIDNHEFQTLSAQEQANLLITAYKYVRYQAAGNSRNEKSAKISHQLLIKRSRLGKLNQSSLKPQIQRPTPPEKGHHTRMLSVSVGQIENKNMTKISFRPAYHSLADNSGGIARGGQINFFQPTFIISESNSYLSRFDVIDITSLAPRDEFFKPIAWRVNFSAHRPDQSSSLTWALTGGPGVAYQLGENWLSYGLGIAHVEYNGQFEQNTGLAAGYQIGALYYGNKWTTHLDYQKRSFAYSSEQREKISVILNRQLTSNSSLRISAQRVIVSDKTEDEASIGFQFHF